MPIRTFTPKETARILNKPYRTIIGAIHEGLLTNPCTDEQVYEILLHGWKHWRERIKRERREKAASEALELSTNRVDK